MRSVCLLISTGIILGAVAGAAETAPIFPHEPDKVYDPGERVDPFTLGKPPVEEEEEKNGGGDTWKDIQKRLRSANPGVRLRALGEMLTAPREDRFDRCLAESAKQIEVLNLAVSYLEQHPEKGGDDFARYSELLEGFVRLEATARRLRDRREIEAEFAGFKLRIDGIVCSRGRASAAVVGGRMVVEGAVIEPAGSRRARVRVRRITPRTVVFLYRGVEIALDL
ncbi:MAG: hypothetical protein ACYTGB_05830 [Planctomycetota bacterium]|jgi:hypothetical protein